MSKRELSKQLFAMLKANEDNYDKFTLAIFPTPATPSPTAISSPLSPQSPMAQSVFSKVELDYEEGGETLLSLAAKHADPRYYMFFYNVLVQPHPALDKLVKLSIADKAALLLAAAKNELSNTVKAFAAQGINYNTVIDDKTKETVLMRAVKTFEQVGLKTLLLIPPTSAVAVEATAAGSVQAVHTSAAAADPKFVTPITLVEISGAKSTATAVPVAHQADTKHDSKTDLTATAVSPANNQATAANAADTQNNYGLYDLIKNRNVELIQVICARHKIPQALAIPKGEGFRLVAHAINSFAAKPAELVIVLEALLKAGAVVDSDALSLIVQNLEKSGKAPEAWYTVINLIFDKYHQQVFVSKEQHSIFLLNLIRNKPLATHKANYPLSTKALQNIIVASDMNFKTTGGFNLFFEAAYARNMMLLDALCKAPHKANAYTLSLRYFHSYGRHSSSQNILQWLADNSNSIGEKTARKAAESLIRNAGYNPQLAETPEQYQDIVNSQHHSKEVELSSQVLSDSKREVGTGYDFDFDFHSAASPKSGEKVIELYLQTLTDSERVLANGLIEAICVGAQQQVMDFIEKIKKANACGVFFNATIMHFVVSSANPKLTDKPAIIKALLKVAAPYAQLTAKDHSGQVAAERCDTHAADGKAMFGVLKADQYEIDFFDLFNYMLIREKGSKDQDLIDRKNIVDKIFKCLDGSDWAKAITEIVSGADKTSNLGQSKNFATILRGIIKVGADEKVEAKLQQKYQIFKAYLATHPHQQEKFDALKGQENRELQIHPAAARDPQNMSFTAPIAIASLLGIAPKSYGQSKTVVATTSAGTSSAHVADSKYVELDTAHAQYLPLAAANFWQQVPGNEKFTEGDDKSVFYVNNYFPERDQKKPSAFQRAYYATPIKADGEVWSSVYHYLCALKFPPGDLRDGIKERKTVQNISNYFDRNKYFVRTDFSDKAKEEFFCAELKKVFEADDKLAQQFIDEVNGKRIVFKSVNPVLGNGIGGKGGNKLGNWLMALVFELQDKIANTKKQQPEDIKADSKHLAPVGTAAALLLTASYAPVVSRPRAGSTADTVSGEILLTINEKTRMSNALNPQKKSAIILPRIFALSKDEKYEYQVFSETTLTVDSKIFNGAAMQDDWLLLDFGRNDATAQLVETELKAALPKSSDRHPYSLKSKTADGLYTMVAVRKAAFDAFVLRTQPGTASAVKVVDAKQAAAAADKIADIPVPSEIGNKPFRAPLRLNDDMRREFAEIFTKLVQEKAPAANTAAAAASAGKPDQKIADNHSVKKQLYDLATAIDAPENAQKTIAQIAQANAVALHPNAELDQKIKALIKQLQRCTDKTDKPVWTAADAKALGDVDVKVRGLNQPLRLSESLGSEMSKLVIKLQSELKTLKESQSQFKLKLHKLNALFKLADLLNNDPYSPKREPIAVCAAKVIAQFPQAKEGVFSTGVKDFFNKLVFYTDAKTDQPKLADNYVARNRM